MKLSSLFFTTKLSLQTKRKSGFELKPKLENQTTSLFKVKHQANQQQQNE